MKKEINNPLVSVVIPTFNRLDMLKITLDSVFKQTYRNFEILIIDDGSTDGTREYFTNYKGKVRYFFQKNNGVSSARNVGIKNSMGEFVAFLDSDDVWFPTKLELQVKYLKMNPDFGMVLCDCLYVDSKGNITGKSSRRKNLPQDGFIIKHVFMHPSLIPSSVLIYRNVLKEIGGFNENLKTAEDLDLHLRIASRYKIGLLDEPLFKYMVNHDGLSNLERTYDDHIFVVEQYIKRFSNTIEKNIQKKVLFETYLSAAHGKFWMKKWNDGFFLLFKTMVISKNLKEFYKIIKIGIKGAKYYINNLFSVMS